MPPPTMVLKSETVACVSVMAPPPLCIVLLFGAWSLLFGAVMASLLVHKAAMRSSLSMMIVAALQ